MANIFRPVYYVKTWWPELQPPDNSLRTWTYNFTLAQFAPSPPPTTPNTVRAPLYIKTHWPELAANDYRSWTASISLALISIRPPGKQFYDLPPVGKYTRQVD